MINSSVLIGILFGYILGAITVVAVVIYMLRMVDKDDAANKP